MNTQDRYDRWRLRRSEVQADADFTDRVMQRVAIHDGRRHWAPPPLLRIVDWIGTHPLAQAAAIVFVTALALVKGAVLLRIGIG